MDHPNPLISFEEYREHVLRWYWYDLPKDATDSEREAFGAEVEEKIRLAWEGRLHRLRNRKRDRMKERYEDMAHQHLHFEP